MGGTLEEADARAGLRSGKSAKGIARIKTTTSFFVCFLFEGGGALIRSLQGKVFILWQKVMMEERREQEAERGRDCGSEADAIGFSFRCYATRGEQTLTLPRD